VDNSFFQEQREQSLIKARIVSKYFSEWAYVMLGSQKKYPNYPQRMAYIDLFAGPGRYDDQSKSTPLLVLEKVLASSDLIERMITMFNDKDPENVKSLKTAIAQLDGIEKLKFQPEIYNEEFGDEISKIFSESKLIPTFFFVDPWGYKGLSLNLVSSIIKDWGCDCVFFFNYNRINMGINNDFVKTHMISLFGDEQLRSVRNECEKVTNPSEREMIIIQELCNTLKKSGSRFVLPFRFKDKEGKRTSHHLIFLSKHFRGYEIMKEIMYNESTDRIDEVASFEYNPRDLLPFKQGTLFELSRPLDDLQDMLLQQYAGQSIDFTKLYEEHSVDKPYIKKNYKDVLRALYDGKKITALNPRTQKLPRNGTFSDEMRITFRGTI